MRDEYFIFYVLIYSYLNNTPYQAIINMPESNLTYIWFTQVLQSRDVKWKWVVKKSCEI